jgi:D-galactonate transporter
MPASIDSAYAPRLGGERPGGYTADVEAEVYRKVSWRLIPFLFTLYIIAYLDRVNVSFAKLQMAGDLHFSDTVYALGAGIFFIGYFFFEVPSNIILQKVGAKLWIARIMILWGIISTGMMFIKSENAFYVMRFLLGVGEAGFFPGIILYLTYWYPSKRRATMVALFMTAIAFSGIVGGPVSGWIMQNLDKLNGWSGWQWLFLLEGIPAVIMGIMVLFYLDDGPLKAKWLSDPEKALIKHYLDADQSHKESVENIHSLGQAFRYPKVWWLSFVYFSVVVCNYAMTFWLPQIVKDMGIQNKFYIGLLTAIPWIAAAIAMVLWGRHSDATGERRWHVVISFCAGAIGLTLSVTFAAYPALAIGALSLAAAGILSGVIVFWSLPTGFLSGAAAAAGIAIINSVGNLGGFAGPYIIGFLKDTTHSTALALYLLSGILLLGAAVVIWLPKGRFGAQAS